MERLPWQLAAIAGLLVGAVSAIGGTDFWQCLIRIGIAFVAFGALGLLLRAVLSALSTPPAPKPSPPRPEADETEQA